MAHTGLGIRMRGWGNFNRAIQADTILLERCVNWGGGGGVISGFEGLSCSAHQTKLLQKTIGHIPYVLCSHCSIVLQHSTAMLFMTF